MPRFGKSSPNHAFKRFDWDRFTILFTLVVLLLFNAPARAAANLACGDASNYTNYTGCPTNNPVAYPRMQRLTHFVNYTGMGYGYVIVHSSTGTLNVAGIPAGSAIIASYLWEVWTGASAAAPTAATFQGSGVTGINVGQGNFYNYFIHPEWGTSLNNCWGLYYANLRFNVGPGGSNQVTGNGSYTASSGAPYRSQTLIIVYDDPASTDITTVAIADGLHLWHPQGHGLGEINDGMPPIPVLFDWSCEGNPICSTSNTRLTRVGGADNPGSIQHFRDGLIDPNVAIDAANAATWSTRWQSGSDVLGPTPDDVDNYVAPAGGFQVGESKAAYRMIDTANANKNTWWVNAVVLSTTCPTQPSVLKVVKSASTASAAVGATVTYTLHYTVDPQSLTVVDTHNDNDGGCIPAGWSVGTASAGCFQEVGGVASGGAQDSAPTLIYNDQSLGIDGQLDVRISVNQWAADDGIVFRTQGGGDNGYNVRFYNGGSGQDTARFYKDGILQSSFAAGPGVEWFYGAAYVWARVVLAGNQFTLYLDWGSGFTLIGSWTDAANTYPSGYSGYRRNGYNRDAAYDEYRWSSCRTVTNVAVWDTLPAYLSYGGPVGTPVPSSGPNPLRWNLGTLGCGSSGDLKFWATINSAPANCIVPNTGAFSSTEYGAWNTNTVNVNITSGCGTTPSPSPTRSPTATFTRTATPSITRTATPTFTLTATPTWTPTRTVTPTHTPTVTLTLTVSPSFTPTVTPTRTATPSFTPSVTVTATPTSTVTRTVTPTFMDTLTFTPTITATPTFTKTVTPTSTFTATPTWTPTFTLTVTATPTFTPTITRTWTPTFTLTLTWTPTSTVTDSPTNTPTQSPGPSATNSVTRTDSPTATPSFTRTVTVTDTPTKTASPTATPSFTRTVTATATPTFTLTWTDSPTQSPGPSPTSTFTVTFTPTFTATPSLTLTATPTFTRTDSPTVTATPTDTPSSTATPTVTPTWTDSPVNSPTSTPTYTATPTATLSFTASHTPTWSPTATPSATRTHSPTASITFTATPTATPSFTATPTATASITFTATPSATPSFTVTSTFTHSPTSTATPTVTLTPVPEPFHLRLTLYNAAGEVVRHLYDGPSQVEPASLETYSVPGGSNGGLAIAIQIFGIASVNAPPPLVWNGDNDNGQLIDNGTYYMKMDIEDSFGKTTALVKEVSILGNIGGNSLAIFNSAGELVRNIELATLPGRLVDFSVDASAGATGGSEGSVQGGLKLSLRDGSGNDHAWTWDGLNDRGAPVASGTYTVRLVHNELGAPITIKTESVILLQGPSATLQAALASALVGPNPVLLNANAPAPALYWKPIPGLTGLARLYDLAGELVATNVDSGSPGRLSLPLQNLASGVYVVQFSLLDGHAILGQRILKLVLVR